MRRFRRFFAMLFAASVFLGAMHEVLHDHHHDAEGHYEQSCPLYLLAQTVVLPGEPLALVSPVSVFEPFSARYEESIRAIVITVQTRAPPTA